MKQGWRSLFVITLPLATLGSLGSVTPTRAQITPDNTLGAESSVVNRNVDVGKGIPSDRIDGGARRGANLFHSFQEFNIDAGRGVYFSNPAGIQNILSRVTGGNPSNILGTLGVLGNANLFFINPNGIIFGPNARLDVGGSFVASTASSVVFPNGLEFSATDPQAPPLLTVNIPIGLRFRDNPGSITNQSISVDANNNFVGLQVPSGNTLALVGGNVSLDGGIVTAAGGRVELGGLAQAGMVGLNPDGSLSFPEGVVRGDVSLTNAASVDVTANGGGSIAVNARNFELSGRSFLLAGITPDSRVLGVQAGDIVINATQLTIQDGSQVIDSTSGAGKGGNLAVTADSIQLTGTSSDGTTSSGLFAIANPGSTGNAGDLTIKTGQLTVQGGAQVSATTFGAGNGGNLTVNATGQLTVQDGAKVIAGTVGAGNGGNLTVNATGQLTVQGGAQVSAATFGKGNSGSLAVTADSIQLTGTSSDGTTSSGLFAQANFGSTGNAGDLTIKTGQLTVQDGAKVIAGTIGAGNGGNLTVNATGQLTVQGGAQVNATTFGKGNSGSLAVTADSIQLTGTSSDGQFQSALFAQANPGSTGNAGNLTIKTGQLTVQGGAVVSASTVGAGKGGNLAVTADSIQLTGTSSDGTTFSALFAQANPGSTGNAGNLTIKTGQLTVQGGAKVSTSTFGAGNGGNLTVTANSIQLTGTSSGLFTQTQSDLIGSAGDLTIKTGQLTVQGGAQVNASTVGAGKGGNLAVTADSIQLTGTSSDGQFPSGLFAEANPGSTGNAGNLTIKTGQLTVQGGAVVSATTFGKGNSGSLAVSADSIQLTGTSSDGTTSSGLFAIANPGSTGNAGDLTINTGQLTVQGGAQIGATTSGTGAGGNISITTTGLLSEVGSNTAITVSTTGTGKSGNINIKAGDLSLSSNAALTGDVNGTGGGGKIDLNVTGAITLDGSTPATAPTGESTRITLGVDPNGRGTGGDLTIHAGSLVLKNGAIIKDSTQGMGDAGNIDVHANNIDISGSVAQSGLPSGLFTSTNNDYKAGNITIKTDSFKISDGAALSARSTGNGQAGTITVTTKSFDASNGGQLVTTTNSSKQPQASNIIITADRMTISGKDQSYNARIAKFPNPTDPSVANDIKQSDGTSGLFASTSGQAQGGDINVTTGSLSLTNNAQLDATTTGQGIGGTVMINANALEINRGGQILTTASNSGKAGDITVNASDRISLENTSSGILANTTSSSTGDGGKITIQPKPNQLKFPDITIADGAQVAANSQGSGKGGDISIQANTLTLNQGTLTASTNKNDGGNIILNLQNYLLLRNKSQIFANAGSGTGGNIKIDTPFIISFPSKNSINSITANATTGEGGKIEINAGLFGIAPLTQQEIDGLRSQPPTLPTQSYIAAYSEKSQNLNGNVTVNSPDVDPSRTIVELPQVVVDPVNKIAQNPCQQGAGSSFIVTGRGGLPRNPNEALSSNNVLVDLVKPVSTSTYSPSATIKPLPSKPTVKRIVPAQGWVFNDKGEVVLTAYDPLGTGHQRTSKLPAACPAF